MVVPEAPLERTEHGLAPAGEGWFVLNAREARWVRDERSACSEFEGETEFEQIGIFLRVLSPGGTMGMYHWEADQEDFLVLSGEALLIVEGEERPLRRWDFFHCPPGTEHIIVGAGDGPCVVLAVGSREHQRGDELGRLHGRRNGSPARCRRRRGDDRSSGGIRAGSEGRMDLVSGGLAFRLAPFSRRVAARAPGCHR